jgi:hypothetical protein
MKSSAIPRQFVYPQDATHTLNRWPGTDTVSDSIKTRSAPSRSQRRLLALLSKFDSPKSEFDYDAEVSWYDIVDATFDLANDSEAEAGDSQPVDNGFRSRWKKEDWICTKCLQGFLRRNLEGLVDTAASLEFERLRVGAEHRKVV